MKKHITKYLLFSIITALFISILISGNGCGDDPVTVLENTDCGADQTFYKHFQNSGYIITYKIGNTRYYGYSAGVLSNVCVKSDPRYTGHVSFRQDTVSHRITFKGLTQWGNNGIINDPGTITHGSTDIYDWNCTYDIDLLHEFPTGPASFNDIRVDVYFPSFGPDDADRNYLLNSMVNVELWLAYKLFLADFSDYIFDFSNQPRDNMKAIMPPYDNTVKTNFVWKN